MLSRTVQGVAVTLALVGAMSAAACGGGGTQEKAPAATSTEPARSRCGTGRRSVGRHRHG